MKKVLFFIPLLLATICLFVGCSDEDEIQATGVLNITFTSWESDWDNKATLEISTIENPEVVLKRVVLSVHHDNKIELNPGNYMLNCNIINVDHPRTLLGNWPVQIQAGKTEIVTIGKDEH